MHSLVIHKLSCRKMCKRTPVVAYLINEALNIVLSLVQFSVAMYGAIIIVVVISVQVLYGNNNYELASLPVMYTPIYHAVS